MVHAPLQMVTKLTPEVLMEHLEFTCGLLRSIVSDAKHRKGASQVGVAFLLRGSCRPFPCHCVL